MKKLFTNDAFFLATVIMAAVGEFVFAIAAIISEQPDLMTFFQMLIRVACVVSLYISYRKHSKNFMKGMMGALLMSQVFIGFVNISLSYSTVALTDYLTFSVILTVFSVLMFINHFAINASHKANPFMIYLNQILALSLAIINTVMRLIWLFENVSAFTTIVYFADILGFIGMVCVVVCVESRLDAYRLDRQAAGWTEEKGYPEGYVHECDKQ